MDISVQNLSKSFNSTDSKINVLNNINLELSSGDIFALMGPNGSGKTTLLKILAGIILPTNGTIHINNKDLFENTEKIQKITGNVFNSELSFYQMLTLEQNLKFFTRLKGILNVKTQDIIEKFGLKDFQSKKLYHCSSGIRQRFAIARALVGNPKILLIDELSRSLDTQSNEIIFKHLANYIKENNAICLFVTHSESEAKKYANKIGYLNSGRIRII